MAYSEGFFSGLFHASNLARHVCPPVLCNAFPLGEAGHKKTNLAPKCAGPGPWGVTVTNRQVFTELK